MKYLLGISLTGLLLLTSIGEAATDSSVKISDLALVNEHSEQGATASNYYWRGVRPYGYRPYGYRGYRPYAYRGYRPYAYRGWRPGYYGYYGRGAPNGGTAPHALPGPQTPDHQ